jgi:hypothetical protein
MRRDPELDMTESEWLACPEPFAPYAFLRDETSTHKTRWQGWVSVRRYPVSERKLRLFACACCARVEDLLPMEEARDLIRAAEAFAEGSIGAEELEAAERACGAANQARRERESPWLNFEREAVYSATFVSRTEAAGRLGALVAAARARAGAAVWRRHVASLGGVLRVKPGEFAPLEAVVRTCDRSFMASELAAEARLQADLLRDVVGNPFQTALADPAWLTWSSGTVGRIAREIYEQRRFQDLSLLADALEDAGCADAEFLSHCRGGGPHARGCWLIDLLLGKG